MVREAPRRFFVVLVGVLTVAQVCAGQSPIFSLPAKLSSGQQVYERYCVGCHGAKGDGKGPAATFLDPKPRDFTSGKFKFASVPSGDLPTDDDLHRTLVKGLSGSSMPAWPLLSERERAAVIAYIKTFSTRWQAQTPGVSITIPEDPYTGDAGEIRNAIHRGEVVYHSITTCWQCHPGYVSGARMEEMYTAAGKKFAGLRPEFDKPVLKDDGWGQPLMPTDFRKDRIRTGIAMDNLFRVIATGIGGTAMPTWKDSIPDEDIWALAYYVRSLADQRNDAVRRLPLSAPDATAGPTP